MNLGLDYIDSLVEEDENEGIYRCKREMFTDPRLFDLEMKHIFEGNWIYLAHESQIPEKNEYYTTQMGRQPIFITRNKNVSGMATPDDLEEFRACQQGFAGRGMNDMSRGATHWIDGPDEIARGIDLHPLMSGPRIEDEGLFVMQHKYWQQQMIRAVKAEQDRLIHAEGA